MSRPEDKNDGDGGGFLGRWARRKQEAQLEAKQERSIASPNTLPSVAQEQSISAEPPSPGAELPLPSLDDVLPGGDVSMFLQKHIPDALRNAALRKAWLADPEISGFIEMADYQWDFTNPDSIPGWSSTLEGIDVKAMVEKVFNNVAPPREIEAEEANLPVDRMNSKDVNSGENIIMDTKNAEKEAILSENSLGHSNQKDHIAAQENTVKSGVYHNLKKRHGSALPS